MILCCNRYWICWCWNLMENFKGDSQVPRPTRTTAMQRACWETFQIPGPGKVHLPEFWQSRGRPGGWAAASESVRRWHCWPPILCLHRSIWTWNAAKLNLAQRYYSTTTGYWQAWLAGEFGPMTSRCPGPHSPAHQTTTRNGVRSGPSRSLWETIRPSRTEPKGATSYD